MTNDLAKEMVEICPTCQSNRVEPYALGATMSGRGGGTEVKRYRYYECNSCGEHYHKAFKEE